MRGQKKNPLYGANTTLERRSNKRKRKLRVDYPPVSTLELAEIAIMQIEGASLSSAYFRQKMWPRVQSTFGKQWGDVSSELPRLVSMILIPYERARNIGSARNAGLHWCVECDKDIYSGQFYGQDRDGHVRHLSCLEELSQDQIDACQDTDAAQRWITENFVDPEDKEADR
jgi:hypothetical protein